MERKEALEVMRRNMPSDKSLPVYEALQTLIPELRESDDERIIKTLQEYVKNRNWRLNGPTQAEVLAWLEKQKEPVVDKEGMYYYLGGKFIYCGYPATEENQYDFAMSQQEKEQKPVEIDKEINRWMGCEAFQEGINITPLPQAMEIVERTAKHFFELGEKTVPSPGGYWEGFKHGVRECQDKIRDVKDTMKEQKQEWSEEDQFNLNWVVAILNGEPCDLDIQIESLISWLKSLPLNLKKKNEDVAKLCSNEWSEEDEEMLVRLLDSISIGNDYKEMRNWLLPKLKSLRPQPKVELSEDVKKTLDEVSHILVGLNYKKIAKDYKQAVEKLLSLRPSWKPSEEQMRGLAHTINLDVYDAQRYKLDTLYNDLKKLM